MANSTADPIFCDNIGNATSGLQCCYLQDQDSIQCQQIFNPDNGYLQYPYGDWVAGCQDPTILYSSSVQLNQTGNGRALFRRYNTCANVPSMVSYSDTGLLSPNISSSITGHFSPNPTPEDLQNVTSAVTDCVTETCKHSRNRGRCYDYCAPVRLLTNSTMPNIQGLNDCLDVLCTGGEQSLPYADADVIGIGVFASYIMQCVFVVLLFLGFLVFEVAQRKPKSRTPSKVTDKSSEASKASNHEDVITKKREHFTDLLTDFHKAQCYFSGTIQIASLSYGIFSPNMLQTFMLIPLATNGVLPVTFTYVLLSYWGEAGPGLALLTFTCWILSSLVYWILYMHIIPVGNTLLQSHSYEQFFYKLAAIPACGDYSALALCQNGFWAGKEPQHTSLLKLRALTPIIWTFATVCFFTVLGWQIHQHFSGRNVNENAKSSSPETEQNNHENKDNEKQTHQVPTTHPSRVYSALFWLCMICYLAGIGMQLSLLAIGTSLNIIDLSNWSFGQIVAVTIWIPPLLEYIYAEIATSRLARKIGRYTTARRKD